MDHKEGSEDVDSIYDSLRKFDFARFDLFHKIEASVSTSRTTGGLCLSSLQPHLQTRFSFPSFYLSLSLSFFLPLPTVTIIAIFAIIFLAADELTSFFFASYTSTLTVDTRPLPEQHHMNLGVELYFPSMGCSRLLKQTILLTPSPFTSSRCFLFLFLSEQSSGLMSWTSPARCSSLPTER